MWRPSWSCDLDEIYKLFFPPPPPPLIEGSPPGLKDRVLALHAGSRGFNSHRGHMSKLFFGSNRPGYWHPESSELENSGIRVASVIAVSLIVGGAIRLIKPAKLYMCTQNTTNTTRTDARQWFHITEPLGERCYENWNIHIARRLHMKFKLNCFIG